MRRPRGERIAADGRRRAAFIAKQLRQGDAAQPHAAVAKKPAASDVLADLGRDND